MSLKTTLLATVSLPALICPIAAAQADSHYSLAQEVISLLSETELTLSSCTDAAGTEAALPKLRDLAAKAAELRSRQQQLPDSTMQEDVAVAALVQDFQIIWGAIRAHIDRLEQAGLLSAELREVLRIAPTTD